MQKSQVITQTQTAMTIGTSIIGVGLLAFPRIVINDVQTGAPVAAVAGVLLVMGASLLLARLGNLYPKDTLFEYGENLIGRWPAKAVDLLIGLYFIELAAIAAREFGEVVVTSVLQRTPVEVTVLTMLLPAAIAARNPVPVLARILTFYMPWVYFPALVIVLLTLKSAHWVNVLPLFPAMAPQKLISAVATLAALFQNFLIVGILIPYTIRPNVVWKSVLAGIAGSGALYLLLLYGTLGIFGVGELSNLVWPTLDLAKTAALPEVFFERLDPIFIAVWVTAVFTGILSSYHIASQALGQLMGFELHRTLVFAIFPFIFTLALLPGNIANLYEQIRVIGPGGLALTIGYPALLSIVQLVRGLFKAQGSKPAPQ